VHPSCEAYTSEEGEGFPADIGRVNLLPPSLLQRFSTRFSRREVNFPFAVVELLILLYLCFAETIGHRPSPEGPQYLLFDLVMAMKHSYDKSGNVADGVTFKIRLKGHTVAANSY
jgi:hypothetical protein